MRALVYEPGARLTGDVVVIPPGLAEAPPLDELRAFARAGGRLLGLGDAVALLCTADLLPGAVTKGPARTATHVRVEGRATPFTWAIPAGRVLPLATHPFEHIYAAPEADVVALTNAGRIVLRTCDASGGVDRGSVSVAGLCDDTGRVVGILGGISHALDCALGRQIGACLDRR